MSTEAERRRARALENALIANVVVHVLALASMALLLLPALPGGTSAAAGARVACIGEHPWLFRLGWLPWQLCAAADLALAVTMVRARFLPRTSAVLALVFTAIAVVPDQTAEALWVTRGVSLAGAGDVDAYLSFERAIFPWSAGVGALFYTLGALAETACFVRARTWSRALTVVSVPLWAAMLLASLSPLAAAVVPAAWRPSAGFVAGANAVGFALLVPWLVLVSEQVLRRARPDTPSGRRARWRYPRPPQGALRGALAAGCDAVANSRFLERALGLLPVPEMLSDITDVIYVNYLVPAAAAEPFVPEGLALQRLGPGKDHALFTFLSYRHGGFGPGLLGPLRRLLPSPVQSNWRVHVVDPVSGRRGVTFLTNAVSMLPHALGARLLSGGMPMHLFDRASITRADDGATILVLDPGTGSAPDARCALRPSSQPPALSGAWQACFGDFRGFLAYCVPQDRALSSDPLLSRVVRQEIHLGIPLDACTPLEGTVVSAAARAIAGDAAPLCFHVAAVSFRFAGEHHDPLGPQPAPAAGVNQ